MRGSRDKSGDSRTPQKLARIGLAEVLPFDPNDPMSARAFARYAFLQTIAREKPAVLADLSACEDDALAAWACHWHLPAWVLPYAHATRRLWATYPQAARTYWADAEGSARQLPDLTDDQAAPPEYDPRLETSASYRARLEAYIARCDTAARQNGVPRPRKDPRAWGWLAAHVVTPGDTPGMSYAAIWRNDPTLKGNRGVVREACVALAALIDLPLPKNHAQK